MKIIAGNWKLNHGPAQARQFFAEWRKLDLKTPHRLVFFPSAIAAEAVAQNVNDEEWGLQNVWTSANGAFTGENSCEMSREMGARWALIGHSERRQLFGETDASCAAKVKTVMGSGLAPMLCIGETLEHRDAGKTFEVLATQLKGGLEGADRAKPIAIAYEPVWAIGTGVVATPEQVSEAHQFIHKELTTLGFPETPILYGGSVKPDNSQALLSLPRVSGFLVGGASLVPQQFYQIAHAGI